MHQSPSVSGCILFTTLSVTHLLKLSVHFSLHCICQMIWLYGAADVTWQHCCIFYFIFFPDPEIVDEDSRMHKGPSAQNVSFRSVPAKNSTTIYTQTVQFLLQNNALQVKTYYGSWWDSDWTSTNRNNQQWRVVLLFHIRIRIRTSV